MLNRQNLPHKKDCLNKEEIEKAQKSCYFYLKNIIYMTTRNGGLYMTIRKIGRVTSMKCKVRICRECSVNMVSCSIKKKKSNRSLSEKSKLLLIIVCRSLRLPLALLNLQHCRYYHYSGCWHLYCYFTAAV